MQEVMLAGRELSFDKLPESSRNWINEKLRCLIETCLMAEIGFEDDEIEKAVTRMR